MDLFIIVVAACYAANLSYDLTKNVTLRVKNLVMKGYRAISG